MYGATVKELWLDPAISRGAVRAAENLEFTVCQEPSFLGGSLASR